MAGPYCAKLLADAGADVIKVEPSGGDPMRRWSATGAVLGEEDGAFFRFLNASKRSVVGEPGDPTSLELLAGADLVVEDLPIGVLDVLELPRRFPALTWVSITPFGRGGPWGHRPATEFTVQAESGSIGYRGRPGRAPVHAGGRIAEWMGGAYAAVPALAAVQRARRTGNGAHIDVSWLEAMTAGSTHFADLYWRTTRTSLVRYNETPSIEPSADGYVGFCTGAGQMFRDLLVLIERPDLLDDPELTTVAGRQMRLAEWTAILHAWTTRHTTAEIVERAAALHIPVAPINNGDTVRHNEHLVAREVFVRDPADTFTHPRPPYLISGQRPAASRPAPRLGEHTGCIEPRTRRDQQPPVEMPPSASGSLPLPLAGMRVLDLTAWWAGPSATHMLAALGADVIHIESIQRPDGARFAGGASMELPQWWEYSGLFLAMNSNKRGLTLNLSDPAGYGLMKRLIGVSDAILDNFSARVLPQFGLDWETVHAVNPRMIMVRMPGFGLDGPWRDYVGFAQTMEQLSGLAFITGHADEPPLVQRGPCDPFAGLHAAFALLVALAERDRTGEGRHVEVPMVEAALNLAAEQVIEFTAYGKLLQRMGNRSPGAAPQGLYACRGTEQWLALSVATEAQWAALKGVLGHPAWADDAALRTPSGRVAAHDRIDAGLERWAAERALADAVDQLIRAGVPAAPVVDPRFTSEQPQMAARGFYEACTHPVAGTHPTPTVPFRFRSVERWLRLSAPMLGQHNHEILGGLLGLRDEDIAVLEANGVIGTRPKGI